MTSLLTGQLASAIYAGFKGKLLKGQLYRVGSDSGLDSDGYPISPVGVLYSCEGFTDVIKDTFKGNTDSTMVLVCIFAKSLPSAYAPLKDDLAFFKGNWYQFVDDSTDPATALWSCRAFLAKKPADVTVTGGVATIT